ncbi:MAG: bifunctional 4-hydroxy-2-oxoglutarate aldolase/2-dehydro-3-deoxy-phosphogluconate aldolase [bacterium]|nr:bifunctional 4-hydroxy-2-oxoglutarate aldolase/2-dehydro-3-deoxy-phosphogluconate aldolase [bacterium]
MTGRPALPAAILQQKLIAVMRRLSLERVLQLAPRLRQAGVGVLEVTLDGSEAIESIAWLSTDGYDAGAGTVLSISEAEAACIAGASFLVSPSFDRKLVEWAVREGIPIVPGALTPSEIAAAWDLGSSAVKLFPASLGGPEYLKAIRGPLASIPIIPTGGVSAANAAGYIEAGAVAVGIGGWLTAQDDLDEIDRRAASLVESVATEH